MQGKNDRESLLPKKISPLLKAIRINWYKMIKELHLWEMEITREEISDLVSVISILCVDSWVNHVASVILCSAVHFNAYHLGWVF